MPVDWTTGAQMLEAIGRVGNYAAGSYLVPCLDCDARFEGHKESRQCLPCAIKWMNERLEEANKTHWIVQFYDENDGEPLTYSVEAPDGRAAVREAFAVMMKEWEITDEDEIEQAKDSTEVIRLWRGQIIGECQAVDWIGKGRKRVSRCFDPTP